MLPSGGANSERVAQPFNRPAAEYAQRHPADLGLPAKDQACLEAVLTKAGGKDHVWVGSNGDGSLADMPERLRATLCKGIYYVLAMQLFRPRLLLHLCTEHNIAEPATLAAYVRPSGVTDHDKMVADLIESNTGAAKKDVKRVVDKLVRGMPLREALKSEGQTFSDHTPDHKWLPQMENDIQKANLQLKDKLSNSGDTKMQVQPGDEPANEDNEEEPEDEGAEYAEWEDGEPIGGRVNTKARDSARAEAAVIVSKELDDRSNRCLAAFEDTLRKGGVIHKKGGGEFVRSDDGFMIRDTKKNREVTGQDFLNKANNAVNAATGFKPTIKPEHFRLCDGYCIPEQVGQKIDLRQRLIRELALQGKPLDADDAKRVNHCIMVILAVESLGDHVETEFHTVVAEWLKRAGKTPFECTLTLTEWSSTMTVLAENYASFKSVRGSEALERAWSQLHARRKQTPLFAFKHDLVPVSRQDEDEDNHTSIVQRDLLQNVDTQSMDALSLVLVCRLMWPQQDADVFKFIKSNYPENQSDGLHCEDTFQGVWKTPVPDGVKHDLKNALSLHIEIAINSPPLIHSSLPAMGFAMGKPVASYTPGSRELFFTLDYLPAIVNYRLDYTTGEITSSERRGVLHSMYKSVRAFFSENGGIQDMAKLLLDGGLGSIMRYDSLEATFRIYDPSTGIWRMSQTDDATNTASEFIKRLLVPIKHLAEFVGPSTFDWLSGAFAPVVVIDDDDGGKSEEVGKKRGRKEGGKNTKLSTPQWPGPRSLKILTDHIFRYDQTPKFTAELLKPLIYKLTAPFAVKNFPHLLPCPNGVIDLRTGELLPKAKPEDFFTIACKTAYDPEADVAPAQAFFDNFFPSEAYDDQEAIVRCIKQWFGYCLTLETRLEICVWFYGEGSNCKSTMTNLIRSVLGDGIHKEIPMASLCKGRGVNNDALNDARSARHITISESDASTKISEAAFRSLVSGEEQYVKSMWEKEKKCKPNAKMTFVVNELPQWDDKKAFCTTRRNLYVLLKKIYVDEESGAGQIEAGKCRAKGMPECLIGKKDVRYFDKAVTGKESAFLRFFVQGAMEYYARDKIDIPPSLKAHQKMEMLDKNGAVEEYVEDYLEIVDGKKTLQDEILAHFRTTTAIEEISFKTIPLIKALEEAIKDKGPSWESAIKYNGRIGSGSTKRGMLWKHVAFKDRPGRMQALMQSGGVESTVQPGRVVTHDRYAPGPGPFSDSS